MTQYRSIGYGNLSFYSINYLIFHLCATGIIDCQDCTNKPKNGESVTLKSISYKCVDGKAIPEGCVIDGNRLIPIGETAVGENFKFDCSMEADGKIVKIKPIACITKDGQEIKPGGTVTADFGTYSCSLSADDGKLNKKFIKDTVCKVDGKDYAEGTEFIGDNVKISCVEDGGLIKPIPKACIGEDGTELAVGETKNIGDQTVQCQPNENDPLKPSIKPVAGVCTDEQGVKHGVGVKWMIKNVEYSCQLVDGKPKVKADGCVTDAGNIIAPNSYNAVREGEFGKCIPGPDGNSLTLEPIPANQTNCDKDHHILDVWIENGIEKRCQIGPDPNKPLISEFNCVEKELGKKVGAGKVHIISDMEAWICESGQDKKLTYRPLTTAEYDAWKNGKDITAGELKGKQKEEPNSSNTSLSASASTASQSNPPSQTIPATTTKFSEEEIIVQETFGGPPTAPLKEESPNFISSTPSFTISFVVDDVNECESGSAKCATDVEECEDLPLGYRCKCAEGYARRIKDQKCIKLDECPCFEALNLHRNKNPNERLDREK